MMRIFWHFQNLEISDTIFTGISLWRASVPKYAENCVRNFEFLKMPKYPYHFSASKIFSKILDNFENGVHNPNASNTTLWISGYRINCYWEKVWLVHFRHTLMHKIFPLWVISKSNPTFPTIQYWRFVSFPYDPCSKKGHQLWTLPKNRLRKLLHQV